MAKQIIEKITDDLDGTEGATTIQFALDGVNWTIDLGSKNAAKFRKILDPYVAVATKAARVPAHRLSVTQRRGRSDSKAIREWAAANGREVNGRGRIPTEVQAAYREAVGSNRR